MLALVRTHVAAVAQAPVPAAPDASLFDAGVLDSWSMVDLVSQLEQALGIEVPDAELRPHNFESLARIASTFERLKTG